MRQVFPTSEIPHKWAHQTQDSARNPQGNFSFSGKVIRSYSTDIAQLYRHKTRGQLVLIDQHSYSNTTAKQLGLIRRAVSHLYSIHVPYPCIGKYGAGQHTADGAHALNVKFLVDRAAENLASAQRAQQVRTVEWRRDIAEGALQDAVRYSAFFGIRRKVPEYPAAAWTAALQRAERIENPDPASADKRERASAKRRERKAFKDNLHAMALRTSWRMGETGYIRHNSRHSSGPIMLRITGDEIETSAGARIPLAAAPLVWERVQRALGKGYKPAGLGVKIGDYPLTEIRPDGTLVAGCHEIPHSELRSMARALGLAAV